MHINEVRFILDDGYAERGAQTVEGNIILGRGHVDSSWTRESLHGRVCVGGITTKGSILPYHLGTCKGER